MEGIKYEAGEKPLCQGHSCGHDHAHQHAHQHDHAHNHDHSQEHCHSHEGCHGHSCGCGHDHGQEPSRKELLILGTGALLLIIGKLLLSGTASFVVLLAAFLLVAFDVLVEAVKNIRRGEYVHIHNLDALRGRGDL